MKILHNLISSSRGRCWLALAVMTVIILACSTGKQDTMENQSPNIVLIVADDLGYGDLGCYGATKIQTPSIDQLASEGMMFTNAYAVSSLCSPSRYSILTGRYSWRTNLKFGVLKYFDTPLIEKDRLTIASLLGRKGYYTECIGKWHLGFNWQLKEGTPPDSADYVFHSWAEDSQDFIDFGKPVKEGPTDRGFDYFFGMTGSNNMMPYVYIENDIVTESPSEPQKAYDHYINVLKAPNWDITTVNQVLTQKAVDAIHDHFSNRKNQPLFLYFPASAIHRPCLPTFTRGASEAGLRGDIVAELDWTVNEIITALKEAGAYENTLLIMTSDNGPRPGDPSYWLDIYRKRGDEDFVPDYVGDYKPEYVNEKGNNIWRNGWMSYNHRAAGPLLGFKSDAWDGGLRVPLIIRWPGRTKPGTTSSNVICLSDLLATFADIVGDTLKENEGEDSYSFYSNILNPDADETRSSLILTGGASGAFVGFWNGWKYIEAAVPGRWPETYYPEGPSHLEQQLYHLSEDAGEQKNLIDAEPERAGEIKGIIERIRTNVHSEGK